MPKRAMDGLTESMFYVLMALCSEPMCGIDAAQYIETHSHGRMKIGPATLYTILAKFEKEGYIREIEVDGRKRTYEITGKGAKAYEAELCRLRACLADAQNAQEVSR